MENNDVAIKIEHLYKNYKMFARKKDRLFESIFPMYQKHGEFSAIRDLNIEIKKGEVLGILGKNGAGKSTLLKMVTGVVTPSSGNIEVNGKISSLLELGTAFNMELTGEENIYQHGQVMGLTKEEIEKKKPEIIEFADIGEHLSQPIKTYSSGMFARLAFACAINVNPDILIVDVIRNCNRAIIIAEGNKVFDGDVKTGVDKYKKMIVGIEDDEETENSKEQEELTDTQEVDIHKNDNKKWKEHFIQNSEMLTYGNGDAEIIRVYN